MPFAAAETVRRGRLGPGELLLVEPGRRAILEDAEAKAGVLRRLPIHDEPRPIHEDDARGGASTRDRRPRRRPTTSCATSPASTPSAPGSTSRRWRSRATSRCGAWATTRRRPAAAASTGRVADHLRQAFAQVTNPAIDPERERVVMDLRVELGRRPALLGGPPRGAADASASSGRSSSTSTGCCDALRGRRAPRPRRSTRRGIRPRRAATGSTAALDRLAREAVAAAARGGRAPRAHRRRLSRSTGCRSRRSSPSAPSTPR